MTREEAIGWLNQIKRSYIFGGDEGFDARRKEAIDMAIEALNIVMDSENDAVESKNDVIKRQDAIKTECRTRCGDKAKGCPAHSCPVIEEFDALPSAQPEEVIPHRNYKYLSDYWCECGWHLGKKGEVKYCARCGRKVNWDG